jgi:DNA-binding MarR family transcriptional regulator
MGPADGDRVITLIALFRQTARLMVDELLERLHEAGYEDQTAAHHPVFENIDQGGTRLSVLAARAGMTHQSMGELVQALERRGYVERRVDPTDSRARLVRLTRRGRRSVRRAIDEIAEIEAAWLERFRRAGLHEDLRDVLAAALREWQTELSPID